jgi:PAS domain S-box-containing protein
MMTGYGEYELALQALKIGASDYLDKPFPAAEILHAVEKCLDRRRLHLENLAYQDTLETLVDQRTRDLKRSETKYRTLIENSFDIIYSLDQHGFFTFVNDEITHALGYQPEQIIGTHYRDLIHLDDFHAVGRVFSERRTGTRADRWVVARLLREKTGEDSSYCCSVEVKARGLYDDQGVFLGTQGTIRDITERRKLEQQLRDYAENLEHTVHEKTRELRNTTQKLNSILQAAKDFFIITFDEKGILRSMNEGARSILGYEPDELVGRESITVFNPVKHTSQTWLGKMKRSVTVAGKYEKELELRRKNNQVFPAQLIVRSLNGFSTPEHCYLCIGQDITSHKAIQDELIRSAKLAATGKLAASIAHEINNPLYGIKNTLEIISEEVSADSQSYKLANLSLEEIERVKNLLWRMLDLYTPVPEKEQLIDVNALLQSLLTFMQPQIEKSQVALTKDFTDTPLIIFGSRDQMYQVFMNLIGNALQAMPDGGELCIDTSKSGHRILVKITDTGYGISEEDLRQVFDAFFTTKDSSHGVGLGLSVSHSILQNHGGKIEVRSQLGQGSTFTVSLPYRKGVPGNERSRSRKNLDRG